MGFLDIVAADSSAAILNQNFEANTIVAAAAVLVSVPYREPRTCIAERAFVDLSRAHEVVVHEAELCRELLGRVKADVVHLDMSLGAISVERLSPIQFSSIRISGRAKRHLLKILPKLRKIAGEITQKHGIEVLAIGKESVPVRIAELTAGAHAILYACERALESDEPVVLGLPSKCQMRKAEREVYLFSLIAGEHDIKGYAEDEKGVLMKVTITETLNPIARGFRAIKLAPKT